MPGKQSKLHYRAMLAEVEDKARTAFKNGDFINPYPADDNRHERFNRRLASIRATDWIFEL